MKLHRGKRMQEQAVELNITAFLNLMVILVPFLLITAVFSRITILELNLPAKDAVILQEKEIKLQLQLVVRKGSFEIRDSNLGRIKYLPRDDGNFAWNIFSDILVEIKSRFPDEQKITLLLDRDVKYRTLIEVMDRVRTADVVEFTEVQTVELFPEISIGDAPQLINESVETEAEAEAEIEGSSAGE
jgi:biopolymer transport protein ExbD